MKKKVELSRLGPRSRRIAPKLRMIANGDSLVNTVRAEQCAVVKIKTAALQKVPRARTAETVPAARPTKFKRRKLKAQPADVLASVFVTLNDTHAAQRFPGESQRKGNVVIASVPLNRLDDISKRPDVAYIEPGETLKLPQPIIGTSSTKSPATGERKFGSASKHHNGRDILIGIIDVQGFDFTHPDFLDASGKTRWRKIWDQGGDARPDPSARGLPFDYGAEFDKSHLDAAIAASKSLNIPAYEIERQSQIARGAHGTHVASIAAGNLGICRKAHLAGVLIDLTNEDLDRRRSFYDSTRIAHAVEYLFHVADDLGAKAVSINISLGTNGHAHDASAAVNRWIDAALSNPRRCVTVAAGNAGQEAAQFEGDLGFVMGRIHTSGRIAASGLDQDIEWVIVGNTIRDVSENELEIWYGPQDRFAVSLRPPDSTEWIGPVEPGEFIENQQLSDGSFFSVYNELYSPTNGANYIAIYLSPLLSTEVVGVKAGLWTVRLHGREVRDGSFHGWIERDDPRRLGPDGDNPELWTFPSFFSTRSNVDNSSVSSLGCGERILCVANLDKVNDRINASSSQGPTRDGRAKPDVAAPGTDIVAANGFDPDEPWIAMSGTSMASPYVAGVAGLMLAIEPMLTAAQIRGIMQRTAQPLPGADFDWRDDAGFGVVDAERCLDEADHISDRKDLTED